MTVARVELAELAGEAIPPWIIDASRARFDGWRRHNPDMPPPPTMVYGWALAVPGNGLAMADRWLLLTVLELPIGRDARWTSARVAERAGCDPRHLAARMVPDLVARGWLIVDGSKRSPRGWWWTVSVPVENPGYIARDARSSNGATSRGTREVHRAGRAKTSRGTREVIARDARSTVKGLRGVANGSAPPELAPVVDNSPSSCAWCFTPTPTGVYRCADCRARARASAGARR